MLTKISILFLTYICLCSIGVPDNIQLTNICRQTLQEHFTGKTDTIEKSVYDQIKSRPIFVTLKKNNQTRGCAGTLQPSFSCLREELEYFTINAATKDFRYPPIREDELKNITIIVTLPKKLKAVESIRYYNPWKHGLLVRKDGKEGVILPCEGKTSSYSIKKAVSQSRIGDIKGADIYIFDCETIVEQKNR
ncbi:AMMECR1 family protein [bacterium]|nr:AMMECR1 family protein [bacterium]